MPSWNPAVSSVYTGRSLPHTWYPERQLFGILNAHNPLQLESKVQGLAYRIHWRPERQSFHTGRFLLAAALYWNLKTFLIKNLGLAP
jgi:hypothetical protein